MIVYLFNAALSLSSLVQIAGRKRNDDQRVVYSTLLCAVTEEYCSADVRSSASLHSLGGRIKRGGDGFSCSRDERASFKAQAQCEFEIFHSPDEGAGTRSWPPRPP